MSGARRRGRCAVQIVILLLYCTLWMIVWPGAVCGGDRGIDEVFESGKTVRGDLTIEVWTDDKRTVYQIGEAIHFKIRANRDCRVFLFVTGSSGTTHRLFPNKWSADGAVEGGKTYLLPPRGADFRFRVYGPARTEVVRAIATLGDREPTASNLGEGDKHWAETRLVLRFVEPGQGASSSTRPESPRGSSRREGDTPNQRTHLTPIEKPKVPAAGVDRSRRAKPSKKVAATQQPKQFKALAVSLGVLQAKLKECARRGECAENLLHLCGMTKIHGYVVDRGNRDLVLVGEKDTSLPSLHVDDFAVALRNVWQGAEPPGCSIDPDPQVMNELRRLADDDSAKPDSPQFKAVLRKWKEECSRPQNTRVIGVGFETRFAKVMVEADYSMKRLVNGSVNLGIDGFSSLAEMTMRLVREDLKRDKTLSIPPFVFNRFWFASGKSSFIRGSGSAWIRESRVILLTEQEFLTKAGKVVGSGRPNPLAKRFATAFSSAYSAIAAKRPIFAQLEALYRFVALVKILHRNQASHESGMSLDYLMTDFPIVRTRVPRTLPGLSAINELRHRRHNVQHYFCLKNCGGVSMDVKVEPDVVTRARTPRITKIRQDVVKARPSGDSLTWKVVTTPPLDL